MVFSSLTFLFLFLPITIGLYYLVRKEIKNYVLLFASLFFYAYGGVKYLYIMILSICVNYTFGILVYRAKKVEEKRWQMEQKRYQSRRKNHYRNCNYIVNNSKFIVVVAVIFNLAIIGYYKYYNFFISNANSIFRMNIKALNIIMPIGISFFTFQSLSYVIDVYRGHGEVQKNPLNVALYISLFPQLIAGPIVRYETVAEQIFNRKETIDGFIEGIERFIFGLGKKVLISNSMGIIADTIFNGKVDNLAVITAWIAAIAYTFQIYFDFSGYSDMAIGLGKMFGFEFLENFNYPYISKSITEFWRRWHISLSTWFRDYVYIPLGGNRGTLIKHIRNIFIVWFLTGMWHGASWTFIAWGLYYGIILTLEKYVLKNYLQKLNAPLKHIYTLIIVIIGWVLFRAESFSMAFGFIKTMFFMNGARLIDNQGMFFLSEYKIEILVAIIGCIPIYKSIESKFNNYRNIYMVLKHIYLCIIFGLCIIFLVKSSFNPFIYFRF